MKFFIYFVPIWISAISSLGNDGNTQVTSTVVMVRHGQSIANKMKIFCGWYDAELTKKGEEEAKKAGIALRNAGYIFHVAYTSLLDRAQKTLNIILRELNQSVTTFSSWYLNERHYGDLTGSLRAEITEQYGKQQVHEWRRSFDIPPPAMKKDHPYYDAIMNDPRYEENLDGGEIPLFESLELTIERTRPYWDCVIVPQIAKDKNILIVGHENNLRGLIMHIEGMSPEDVMNLTLPNGVPLVYKFDKDLKPIAPHRFLDVDGDKASASTNRAQVEETAKTPEHSPSKYVDENDVINKIEASSDKVECAMSILESLGPMSSRIKRGNKESDEKIECDSILEDLRPSMPPRTLENEENSIETVNTATSKDRIEKGTKASRNVSPKFENIRIVSGERKPNSTSTTRNTKPIIDVDEGVQEKAIENIMKGLNIMSMMDELKRETKGPENVSTKVAKDDATIVEGEKKPVSTTNEKVEEEIKHSEPIKEDDKGMQ